jgi:hypothetical protein
MTFDREVWHIANMMLMVYGRDATYEAGSIADEMMKLGDPDGAVQWLRVTEAVDELQRHTTHLGGLLH